jgi:hypothetical protein
MMRDVMRKLIFVAAGFLFFGVTSSKANDIYVAQSAAAAPSGTNCGGARGVSTLSSADWSPGNTIHLCGTFTGGAGSTLITAQGSGTSGNPITILFEAGATLSAPYWSSSGGAINVSGRSFIAIDGGSNGIIQNTANGTGLAYQATTTAIYAQNCQNCEFKNLTIQNLYVHTSPSDTAVDTQQVNCIQFYGSNMLIHDNVMHDAGWCLYQNYHSDANVQIYNNHIYNMSHGVWAAGAAYIVSSEYIYNNHFGSMANWGTGSTDAYHLTVIHAANGSGGKIQNMYIYNNLFDGSLGTCCITGHIFLESSLEGTPWTDATGTAYIWNNVLIADLDIPNGLFTIGEGMNHQIYNNTLIGPNAGNNGIALQLIHTQNVTIENNVIEGFTQLIGSPNGASYATIDYNTYGWSSGGNPSFQYGSKEATNLASWQSICGCDAHSTASLGGLLTGLSATTGVPSIGFPGISAGTNLTSLATGALASLASDTGAGDQHTPVQRPSSGPWDIGAYDPGGVSASAPNPPTGLIATVN